MVQGVPHMKRGARRTYFHELGEGGILTACYPGVSGDVEASRPKTEHLFFTPESI